MSDDLFADLIQIVLVEPKGSLNVGSVARAMSNLGFSKLHLVAPRNYSIEKASVTACWGSDVLTGVHIHENLEGALSGMQDVVAFSGRTAKNRNAPISLEEWIANLDFSSIPKTALVFGPEESGLTSEQISTARTVVRIPSVDSNSAYNLSQATLLALYRIYIASNGGKISQSARPMPDWNGYYQLDRLVEEVGTESGFFRQGTPPGIPKLVRNLFRRINFNQRELRIITGYLGRMLATLRYHKAQDKKN